jgi:NADH-quinone oxidoreductase subunit E
MDADGVVSIVEKHKGQRGAMVSILEDLQERDGYLTRDGLELVAERTGRPLVDVYGVATFYRYFRLKPRGKHLCSVCLGTACHVRGAPRVKEEVERQLDVKAGGTTADGEFTLETVNCLGACALGPVVVVDGRYFSAVSTTKVGEIFARVRAGVDTRELALDPRVFPIAVRCARCNRSLMDAEHRIDDAPSIRVTAVATGQAGWLRFSSLYGSGARESQHRLRPDTLMDVYCPHCHEQMKGTWDCPECGAPMASMVVAAGGMLQLCSRVGCRGQMLDVS